MAGATELTGKRRVWKLAELSILHQVPKPVLVVLNLLSYSETRSGPKRNAGVPLFVTNFIFASLSLCWRSGDGVQEFSRVWFQNDASVQAIGTAGAYLAVETLSDEKQRKRREYLRHAMEVRNIVTKSTIILNCGLNLSHLVVQSGDSVTSWWTTADVMQLFGIARPASLSAMVRIDCRVTVLFTPESYA